MRHCEVHVLPPDGLLPAADGFLAHTDVQGHDQNRMQFAYAMRSGDELEVRYVMSRGTGRPHLLWRVRPEGRTLPSLAERFPLLGWYEREMQDLEGLEFTAHPEPHPLVIHEGFTPAVAPLVHGFDRHGPTLTGSAKPPIVPRVIGPEIQRLPFGPVRADVVESAQFLFFYIGEGILHYHPRLFYKHRAMEARFTGANLRTGSVLAERVSGIDSLAHALAYAQAVEAALGWRPPERALLLRVILAELERLYNHLQYLGHLSKTTTLKVGDAEGHWLEERVKQINGKLTGSRFLRGVVVPGGLRRDLDLSWLGASLERIAPEIEAYLDRLAKTGSYLDRLMTTGRLSREVAFDQGATGPVERASGLDRDLRRDHSYAAYGRLDLRVPVRTEGDALARAWVRMEEIRASLALLRAALAETRAGPILQTTAVEEPDPDGEGLGWVEAARGGLLYAVHLERTGGETLRRVKIKEPSFSNWRVFPFTVQDTNMMDYAINEASFGLSIAGADR